MQPLSIVFENEELLIVNKPAGVSVQGGKGISRPLDATLSAQVGHKVHLVHRLDKETSGLLLVAKDAQSAAKWSSLIASREVTKEYDALCTAFPGTAEFPPRTGTLDTPVVVDGKPLPATTAFRTEQTGHLAPQGGQPLPVSHLHLTLGTGRTHQIRIQLLQAGFPIIGDDQHGAFRLNKAFRTLDIRTLCLAATRLTIPLGGTTRTFEVPLPSHMRRALGKLACK